MSKALFLAPFLLLAACGGADPTPDPDEAATAGEVNAAVNRAEAQREAAQHEAE